MADGTVRGGFELDAGQALGSLRSIRDIGKEADESLAGLGKQMDSLGGLQSDTRLDSYKRKLSDVASAADDTAAKVSASWDAQSSAIDKAATKIEARIDRLQTRLDRYGESRSSAEISLKGFEEVNAQLKEVQMRLNSIGRRSATAKVGVRESSSGGGVAGESATAGRGGSGGMGLGLPGGFFGKLAAGALALSPGIQGLLGGGTALAGSAGSAALGVGTVALGGYGTVGAGIALTAGAAIPAIKNLGALSQAQQKYTQQVKEFGRASSQAATAKRAFDAALAGASPQEARAATALGTLQSRYMSATRTGRNSIYGAATNVLRDARGALPSVAGDVNQASAATAGAATSMGGFLTNPQSLATLKALTGSFVQNLPIMENSLQHVATIIEHLAVDALPFFHDGVVWVDQWTAGLAKSSSDTAKVSHDMTGFVDSAKDWAHLAGAVGHTLTDLLGAGAPSGDSMVVQLTKTFDRWDKWIDSHPEKVTKWFDSAAATTEHIADVVGHVTGDVSKIATQLTPVFDRGLDLIKALANVGGGGVKGLATVLAGYEGVRLLSNGGLPSSTRVLRSAATRNPASLFGASRSGLSGFDGSGFKVGSATNPIAVLVVDQSGSPSGSSRPGSKGPSPEEDAGKAGVTAAEKEAGSGGVAGLLSKARGGLSGLAEKGARGGAIAAGGYLASQLAVPVLQSFGVSHHAANVVGNVGKDASIGAGLGSFAGAPGTLAGGAAGTVIGLLANLGHIRPASMTAGASAGISSMVSTQLNRYGGAPGQSAASASSYAGTANDLASITKQAQSLNGGLNALGVNKLKDLQSDAKQLANDPSLGKFKQQLTSVANNAQDALVNKTAGAFDTMRRMSGKSLGQIEAASQNTSQSIQQTLGKGSAAARDTLATNYQLAAKDIAVSMKDGVTSTSDGINQINDMLSKALKALGLNISPNLVSGIGAKGAVGLINRAKTGGSGASSDSGSSTGGGSGHGATYARGGLLDTVDLGNGAKGAPGEAWIANRHTMNELSNSTLKTHGKTAWQMIRDETRPHSWPGARRQYARGGDLGGAVGGGPSIAAQARRTSPNLGSAANNKMGALLAYAREHNTYGEDGLCLTHVQGFMDAVGYPGGVHGPGHEFAWDFAVDARAHAASWGLEQLGSGDPYAAPPGAVVVVPHPNPGTSMSGPRPGEAGDISVASGTGAFYNGGQNSYGGPGAVHNAVILAPAGYKGGKIPVVAGGAGGAGAAASRPVPHLRAPRLLGGTILDQVGQGVVNKATDAANQYLDKNAGAAGGLAAGTGPVLAQMYKALRAGGFNRSGASGVIGSAYGESSWNPASVGSGGGGLWGFTASPISLADLQGAASSHHIPWTNATFQTDFLLQHTTASQIAGANNAGSPEAAAAYWVNHWEHPLTPAADIPIRAEYARKAYNMGFQRGGRAPSWAGWHARGGDFVTNGPTLLGAGENGRERVTVTPINQKMPGGGTIHVHMAGAHIGNRAEAKRIGQQVATEILEALDRVGSGATDAQLMGADA